MLPFNVQGVLLSSSYFVRKCLKLCAPCVPRRNKSVLSQIRNLRWKLPFAVPMKRMRFWTSTTPLAVNLLQFSSRTRRVDDINGRTRQTSRLDALARAESGVRDGTSVYETLWKVS